MNKVTVVTACTGDRSVLKAIESVRTQTETEHIHLLVVDGPVFAEEFNANVRPQLPNDSRIKILELPWNTGHDGYYCYRIYALAGLIVDTPWIAFLDQDCYWEENHLESLTTLAVEKCLSWVYSLRKIIDLSNAEAVNDNCESIGPDEICWQHQYRALYHGIAPKRPWSYLVDMNSYLISRDLILHTGPHMIQHKLSEAMRKAGDRVLLDALRQSGSPYACSGKHTAIWPVNAPCDYRDPAQDEAETWSGNRDMELEFFRQGNSFMREKYGTDFPWTRQDNPVK